ncbi:hypothetical protein BGX27_010844 [Mortierella sp. AM989]|nr:hypothetical protein BGX27_010844 [Mortierella sp. AM989]
MISSFKDKISDIPFPDGSYVMAIDPRSFDKLQPVYEGPFMVVRRTTGGSYALQDATGALTPRNYAPSQLRRAERDDSISYEIEAVLQHRQRKDVIPPKLKRTMSSTILGPVAAEQSKQHAGNKRSVRFSLPITTIEEQTTQLVRGKRSAETTSYSKPLA